MNVNPKLLFVVFGVLGCYILFTWKDTNRENPNAYYQEACARLPLDYHEQIIHDLEPFSYKTYNLSELVKHADEYAALYQYSDGQFYRKWGGEDAFLSSPYTAMIRLVLQNDPVLPDTFILIRGSDMPLLGKGKLCPNTTLNILQYFHGTDPESMFSSSKEIPLPVFSAARIPDCHYDILFPYNELMGMGDWFPAWYRDVIQTILMPLGLVTIPRTDSYMSALFNSKQWHFKENKLVWRGRSSGGHGLLMKNHRVRMVVHTNYKTRVPELYDVGFTSLIKDDDKSGDSDIKMGIDSLIKPYLTLVEQEHQFKYVLDIDGNSYSLRLASLLMSDMLVFRTGVYEDVLSRALVNQDVVIDVPLTRLSEIDHELEYYQLHDDKARDKIIWKKTFYRTHANFEVFQDYARCLFYEYNCRVTIMQDLAVPWIPMPITTRVLQYWVLSSLGWVFILLVCVYCSRWWWKKCTTQEKIKP